VRVKYLNIDLGLLWKDLGLKLGGIVEDYKAFLFKFLEEKLYVL
jgi:hypothetical protein